MPDCIAALANSELGRVYFPEEEKALASLAEGVAREEVFVAVDEAGECLGFIWFTLGGAFHSYPYLHVIAVKEEHRAEGIGKKLLAFFEECFRGRRESIPGGRGLQPGRQALV